MNMANDNAKHADALEMLRHSTAHLLAHAVLELFPGTQAGIGPAVDNGFFYDFLRETPFSTEDLCAIEEKMRQIVALERDKVYASQWFKADTQAAVLP